MWWNKFLLVSAIFYCGAAFAQRPEIPDSLRQHVFVAGYHSGFIFAHSIHVQNTKGTKPDGFELEYSHLRTDSASRAHYSCYPRSGFNFTYTDFNKQLLGQSYSLCYFIEPNYRIGNWLHVNVRAAAGLSYMTNPFDSVKNPENQSYSWPINTLLQLGFGVVCPLTKHFALYGRGNFFHNSNGGFQEPNAGVNYINASVGLQYFAYSNQLPVYRKARDTAWRKQPVHIDVSAFYSPKGGFRPDSVAQRKFVAGACVQVVKRVGNIDAIMAGAEIYYDDGLHTIKKVFIQDESSSTMAGILLGHQFLINRFTFSQELGIYIYKRTDRYNELYADLFHTVYHRWGLSYQVRKHWFVGLNLLAHNQIADFIDGRLTYRIK
jgi:hypothetical protein